MFQMVAKLISFKEPRGSRSSKVGTYPSLSLPRSRSCARELDVAPLDAVQKGRLHDAPHPKIPSLP